MADIYVRSTDGNDADDGSTWALAKATLAGAAGIDAAGDTIWLSQNHAESSASSQTIALAGTAASNTIILCGNDSSEPPTSLTTGATISTTGSTGITVTGCAYLYGITLNAATLNSAAAIFIASGNDNYQTWEQCNLYTGSTNGAARITFGSTTGSTESSVYLLNCNYKFTTTGSGLSIQHCNFRQFGGSIDASSSAITTFIATAPVDVACIKICDFDFSNADSALNLVAGSAPSSGRIDFVNCKMPASWSGGLVVSAPINPYLRVSAYNCDSSNTNYRLWIETYAGSIKSETTIVKTGGASDGTTALSWKMTTTANANEYVAPLISDDMVIWIDTTGSSKTITVDIVHDSTTALTDAEVWLEVDYLGSSAAPLGTPASDKRATVLTTAASQTTSSATWTTTGLTNPNKQKLEVTFTPNMKGFIYARVCLAKASYTVYVDFEPTIA